MFGNRMPHLSTHYQTLLSAHAHSLTRLEKKKITNRVREREPRDRSDARGRGAEKKAEIKGNKLPSSGY